MNFLATEIVMIWMDIIIMWLIITTGFQAGKYFMLVINIIGIMAFALLKNAQIMILKAF